MNVLKPKQVIFTHIEETEGLNFDAYKKLEEQYENVLFAYDGMSISV